MGVVARLGWVLLLAAAVCVVMSPKRVCGRKTLVTNKRLSSRFLGYDEGEDKFHEKDYAVWVGERIVAVLIVGLLHLIAIPVYLAWSCCCKPLLRKLCCVSCMCSCCKDKRDEDGAVVFSAAAVHTLKILVVAVAVVAVVVTLVGLSSNAVLQKGLADTTDDIVSEGQAVVRDVRVAADRLLGQARTAGSTTSIEPAVKAGDDALARAQDIDEAWDNIRPTYQLLVYGLFAVPLVLWGLGALCGLFNVTRCKLLVFVSLVTVFLLFAVLTVASLHVGLWIVTDDMCDEVDLFFEAETSSKARSLFREALNCVNATGGAASGSSGRGFAALDDVLEDALRDARAETCVAVNSLCGRPNALCPAGACNAVTVANYASATLTTTTVTSASVEMVTFEACASVCNVTDEFSLTSTYVNGLEEIANYTDIKSTNLDPILQCQFVDNVVGDIRSNVCHEAVPALYTVTLMLLILVGVLDVGAIFLCRGQRRFGSIGEAAGSGSGDSYEYEYGDYEYGDYEYGYEYEEPSEL